MLTWHNSCGYFMNKPIVHLKLCICQDGDNNKHGTSGQGSSSQSNQPFVADEKQKKSNHNKATTGTQPSRPQEKTNEQSSNRNMSVGNAKE